MTFTAIQPIVAYALLAVGAALVILLYLLKPKIGRVVVPSLLMWRVVVQDQRRSERWRWLLSVSMALCLTSSLMLALLRPQPNAMAVSPRLVLVLDDSPSMATRTLDGKSRWHHAIELARSVIERAGAGREMMVLDTMGALVPADFVGRDEALRQLDQLSPASFGSARFPHLPGGNARIHFFTDGVAELGVLHAAIEHSTFEQAENVAITAFEARPLANDPVRYQAVLQVLNASAATKSVRIFITGAQQFELTREVTVAAGQAVDETFDVTPYQYGVLRAEVRASGDAFDLDNMAYAMVLPHRTRKILVVGGGNTLLEDSVRSLPGVAATISSPGAYASSTAYDAFFLCEPAQCPADKNGKTGLQRPV